MTQHFPLPTLETLRKYDQPGPRYTSYPTVPDWTQDFTQAHYREALQLANQKQNEPLSLYVHLPYCEHLCLYCGCNIIVTRDHARGEPYLDHLDHEMSLVAKQLPERRTLNQMHWGGGTPTFLSANELVRLMGIVRKHFKFTADAEIGIEVDPRVTSDEQLERLREVGFNRLSVGVQDFNTQVQKSINRVQTEEETAHQLDHARKLGFVSTNVDLIYGLPNQSEESIVHTVDAVVRMKAARVALYGYAHVPWLRPHQKVLEKRNLPAAEKRLEIFSAAMQHFMAQGYVPIGMDHFARPDDSMALAADNGTLHRNFMGYTVGRAEEMLGFGTTAIGDIGNAFIQNVKEMEDYEKALAQESFPIVKGHRRSLDDNIRRRTILDLMCKLRLNLSQLSQTFSINAQDYYREELPELKTFIDDKMLSETRNAQGDIEEIRVTPLGRLFVRNICMVFDSYLRARRKSGPSQSGEARFSRTV